MVEWLGARFVRPEAHWDRPGPSNLLDDLTTSSPINHPSFALWPLALRAPKALGADAGRIIHQEIARRACRVIRVGIGGRRGASRPLRLLEVVRQPADLSGRGYRVVTTAIASVQIVVAAADSSQQGRGRHGDDR